MGAWLIGVGIDEPPCMSDPHQNWSGRCTGGDGCYWLNANFELPDCNEHTIYWVVILNGDLSNPVLSGSITCDPE